jgi:hypothetical protein
MTSHFTIFNNAATPRHGVGNYEGGNGIGLVYTFYFNLFKFLYLLIAERT